MQLPTRGRPRLTPARFRYRRTSELVKGDYLARSDKLWLKAVYALPPDLRRTWFFVRRDGRLDRRVRRWFTDEQVYEWRRYVQDTQDRELNR